MTLGPQTPSSPPPARLRLLIVNINHSPLITEGCEAIAAAFERIAGAQELIPDKRSAPFASESIETRVRPWRTLLDPSGALAADLARWSPSAVVLGPNETPFPAYPPAFDRFLGWVRARRGPTLGICGGHQAIALAHGAPVAPVHDVPAASTSYAGMPKVSGPIRIRLMGDPDPLVADLPEEFDVMASHVDEVKDLPVGFRVLAIGSPSRIQILRADRRPLWGVQFHPERPHPTAETQAGDRLLANFLAFVRAWRTRFPQTGMYDRPGDPPQE
jgi:GMP synthase-like glutamine amidotransferase